MASGDTSTANSMDISYQVGAGGYSTLCNNINSESLICTVGQESSPLSAIANAGEGNVDIRFTKVCEAASDGGIGGGGTEIAYDYTTYTINWDTDSNDCAAAGHTWIANMGTNIGSTPNCCGDDGANDDWATYSGTLTTSTSSTCKQCADGADQGSTSLYGNGYLGAGTTSRTCYYGDIACTSTTASSGASQTVYGWGYYTGTLSSSTTIPCRSAAATCTDGTAASDSITTLYGNGYISGTTCYHGDITCASGSESSGTSCTLDATDICGNGVACTDCSPYQRSSPSVCYSSCATNDDDKCISSYHCSGSNTCVSDFVTGTACVENSDCSSNFCRDDYDSGDFCAADLNDCVHDGVTYNTSSSLNGWYCNSGTWQDQDTVSSACTSASNVWLADGTGTNSDCCGDDDSSDDFEQTSVAGRSVCIDGTVRSDTWTSGAFLVSDGQIYSCNSASTYTFDTDHTTTTCSAVESKYCNSDNTWKTTKSDTCSCSSGTDCTSGLCIEGTCQSSCNGYTDAVNKCSDGAYTYSSGDGGVCVYDDSVYYCDTDEVADDDETGGFAMVEDCAIADYSDQCDSDVAGGFSVDGVCGSTSNQICMTSWAADPNNDANSPTVGTAASTEADVCTIDGYYCDDVSDGIWSPGDKRCDASDTACRTCNLATSTDSESLCEIGCGADSICDEQAIGYDWTSSQTCHWCSSTCTDSTDTTVGSVTCTTCASGYQHDDTGNSCYYGVSCNNEWLSSNESCNDACVDDNDGGSCSTSHTITSSETCYYDDTCSGSGCGFSSNASLRIDYCDTCGASGVTSGTYCPSPSTWEGTTCYYNTQSCTGTSCNLDTSSTSCSSGTSTCCTDSSTIWESVGCTVSGITGTSYDRDTSQTRCESTATGCSDYTWMANVPTSGTRCCGDDIGLDDSYYYSSSPTTSESLSCERCADGTYHSAVTLYGNGYVDGSTCYYGNIDCSSGSTSDGSDCTLDATDICGDGVACSDCSPYQRSSTSVCYPDCATNDDSDCISGYHCDDSYCVTDVGTGTACVENSDCTSGYCRDDYDDGKFCADDSTSCQHDSIDYNNGIFLDGWTCQSGVWNDITSPAKLTLSNVDADSSSPYWDTSDNSQTLIQLSSAEPSILCRISTQNTDYDSMGSYTECTPGSTVECDLSLAQSASYDYYVACKDSYGNLQEGSNITAVSFGVDWTDPSTYVTNYSGNHLPGSNVTFHEDDNIGDSVTILTWYCQPGSECSPATPIDDIDNVTFSSRGINYLRWYSKDAAENPQDIQQVTVTVNSLPVITDSDMDRIVYPPWGYDGQNGETVQFTCKGTDNDGTVEGPDYTAKIWLRTSGSGTWNKLSGSSMVWGGSGVDVFYKDYNILDPYNTVFDMMCEITDDMGESANNTELGIFTVINTPPFVDDIYPETQTPVRFTTTRWWCAGADIDNPVHLEEGLTATFSLTERGDPWSLWGIENVTLGWDSVQGEHYYDHYVTEEGGTHYDARCILDDGVDTSTLYVEMNVTGGGTVNSTGLVETEDDWDSDGTGDSSDYLEGQGDDLNTSLTVDVKIDGETNNTPSGDDKTVEFKIGGETFVKFQYDFNNESQLLLPLISVYRNTTGEGSVLVHGLSGVNKTLHVPKVMGVGVICVKNAEVTSISEITDGCSGAGETLFSSCDTGGETKGGITCTDKGTYYEVTGLTNSAAKESGTARLEIWSSGSYLQLDDMYFYANYTNSSSDNPITTANCDIWFTDTGWENMTYNATSELWAYDRIFTSPGVRTYNVSCTDPTYTNLSLEDNFNILTSAIPEFSFMTLGLGLIAVLAGIILFRRKR